MDYVAGYVVFNDITARDIQRREMQSGVFSFCKAIDTFCPLGPWIVTADEIGDPHDLGMQLRVNGETRQVSNMSKMSTTVPEVLSHYSPLGFSAGDVLSLGTVSGVAGFSDDPASLYLKPGDVVEAEIDRIGVLRNPVISWEEAHGEPAPPSRDLGRGDRLIDRGKVWTADAQRRCARRRRRVARAPVRHHAARRGADGRPGPEPRAEARDRPARRRSRRRPHRGRLPACLRRRPPRDRDDRRRGSAGGAVGIRPCGSGRRRRDPRARPARVGDRGAGVGSEAECARRFAREDRRAHQERRRPRRRLRA